MIPLQNTPCSGRCQRGIAAVELALILPVFLILLTFPLFFGRLFWHYSVMERAANNAARYLSAVALSEIKNSTRAPTVVAVANAMVQAEIAELAPGPIPISITVLCDVIGQCVGQSTPATVTVTIQVEVSDIFFSDLTGLDVPLTASVTYPYLGR